jgi:hypothetical protein
MSKQSVFMGFMWLSVNTGSFYKQLISACNGGTFFLYEDDVII